MSYLEVQKHVWRCRLTGTQWQADGLVLHVIYVKPLQSVDCIVLITLFSAVPKSSLNKTIRKQRKGIKVLFPGFFSVLFSCTGRTHKTDCTTCTLFSFYSLAEDGKLLPISIGLITIISSTTFRGLIAKRSNISVYVLPETVTGTIFTRPYIARIFRYSHTRCPRVANLG